MRLSTENKLRIAHSRGEACLLSETRARSLKAGAPLGFWILQLLGWAAFGAYKWIVAPKTRDETVIAVVIGIGLTTALRWFYKRLLSKPHPLPKIVVLAFGCSVLAGLMWPMLVETITSLFRVGPLPAALKANLKFPLASSRVFVFLVWSALYFGVTSWRDLQEQKTRALEATILAQEAHLAMLRQQLNPHFLFNALNSLRALIEVDAQAARHVVTALAEFLRYSLRNANASCVTLREELEAVRHYLEIEKIRFGNRLEIAFDIALAAEHCLLPGFLLQPLVENAVKYGMQTSVKPLQIKLAAHAQNGALHLEVSNTGAWVSPAGNAVAQTSLPTETKSVRHASGVAQASLPALQDGALRFAGGAGIGLQNVQQRLQQMFPNKSRFEIRAGENLVRILIEIDQTGVCA